MEKELERRLLEECDAVEKLSSRATRDVWRAWNERYPLPKKRPHAILEDTIINQLFAVPRTRKDRHAFAEYVSAVPTDVYVLMVGPLVGWRCTGPRVPRVDRVDANVLVTAVDLSWTYGSVENWRRYSTDSVFLTDADI